MRARRALLLLPALLAVAEAGAQAPEAAGAEKAAQPPAVVYGLEVETRGDTQRLLVFADRPVAHRLEEPDADRVVLVLPRAALDPTAPRRVRPGRGGAIVVVRAEEKLGGDAPEVRIVVRRAPGAEHALEQRGATLALSFAGGAPTERVPIAFEDEDLPRVVDYVAGVADESFVYDEKLQGRVSIASTEPVTPKEARAILDTVLLLEGFAAVPTPGGPLRIMPIQQGKAASPFELDPDDEASEAALTTFVRLKSAEASSVASILQPWVGQRALLVPQAETNGLIVAASEHRVHQLLGLVRILDQAASEELLLRRIRHRDVEEVASLLEGILERGPVRRQQTRVWSDPRTNTLLVKVAPEYLDELRAWLDRIDRRPPAEGVLHVRRIRNADPEALAGLLRDVAAGEAGGAGVPVLPGTAPQLQSGSFSVVTDPASRSLLIQADAETYAAIEDLLEVLDVPPPRIDVEVVVWEIATDSSLRLGLDAFVPLTSPNSPDDWVAGALLDPSGSGLLQPGTSVGGLAARYSRQPVVVPIIDAAGNPVNLLVPREAVVIEAEQRELHSRVLLRPHILAVSGEEHEITVGDNIPILQAATTDGAGNAFQTRTNVQRQDVGVTLRVRPSLGQAGHVRLELDVEATRVAESLAGDTNLVGPTIEQRKVTSTIWLSDDEIVVVGVGRFPEHSTSVSGVPWLKDIPGLGYLFRVTRERTLNANLLVTAQARVHTDDADLLAETIRRRLAVQRILSREGELVPEDGPYALRLATHGAAREAEAIAAELARAGERTRVVRWDWQGKSHWDVYLVGFETPRELGEASLRARSGGWEAELVVVQDARAS